MDLIPSTCLPATCAPGGASGTHVAQVVFRADDGVLTVDLAGARSPARVALSCLVQPEPGDLVLVGGTSRQLFILALLERREPSPLRLVVEADLEIAAPAGRITLAGNTAVNLASPAGVCITAGEVTVRGRTARLTLDELTYAGAKAAVHLRRVKLIGEVLETFVVRLLQRASRSYRFVEGGDHVRSGEVDYRAVGNLHLRGKNAVVTAEAVAKVDGGQIHLG